MTTYISDEVTFEIPDGFADQSMTMLSSTKPSGGLNVVVSREPTLAPLQEHVTRQVAVIQKIAPQTKVLGVRDRDIGSLPGREAKLATFAGKQPIYVRQAYVDYYGTMLSFSVTSQRTHQLMCDAAAERLLTGVKFRRR